MSSISTAATSGRRARPRKPAFGPAAKQVATARRRKLLNLVPRVALLGYCTLHVVGTHIPPDWFSFASPVQVHVSDKLLHFLSYTGMTLVVLAALATVGKFRRAMFAAKAWWLLPALCLALAAFGLCDEMTQPLVGRNFDWLDWVANVAGISTATVLVSMGVAIYTRRTQAVS